MLPVVQHAGQLAVIEPATGQLIPLTDAAPPLLAQIIDELDAILQDARTAKNTVSDELRDRMGTEKHMDAGLFTVEQVKRRDWDKHATTTALAALVASGHITVGQADEAMPERTERRPDGRRLNALLVQLAGDDPVAAQGLARARSESVYLRLSRSGVDSTVTA